MQSPGVASPKVLKLHARKQKAQNTQQFSGPSSSGLFNNSKTNHFHVSANNWTNNNNNIQHESAEVYERFDYLSKLKEENEVLVTLLKEIQLNKDELTKRMRELEMTRDAILSLRPSVTKDMIDSYLTDTCPLASKNRPSLNLTTNQSVQAREVYDRMLNIAGIFRTNQAELQDFFMQELVTASDHFINDEFAACDRAIERMENVMRAGPRNVASAQELANRFEESIFQASAEHFTQLLQEEVAKRNSMEPVGFGESKNTDHQHQSSADHEALLEHHQSEIQDLTAQNETLRVTVTELREKIAKLKTSSSASGSASSSAKVNNNNSVYILEELKSTTSPAIVEEEFSSPVAMKEEKDTATSHVLAQSPWVVTLLQDKFSLYVQQVVDGHPLANVFTAPALQTIAAQITEELSRNTGLTMFLGRLKQQHSSTNNNSKNDVTIRESNNDEFLPYIEKLLTGQLSESDAKQLPNNNSRNNNSNNEEDLFGIGVDDIPTETNNNNSKTPYLYFEEIASQLLRLSVMHQEIACLATLLMTYMRQRLQIVASPILPGTPQSAANNNNGYNDTNTNNPNNNNVPNSGALNLVRPAVPVKSVTPTLLAATAAVKMRNAAANSINAAKTGNLTPNRAKNANTNNYYYETPNNNNVNNNWHTADDFVTSPTAGGELSEPYLYRTHSRDNSVNNANNNLNVPRYMMPKNVAVTSGGAILPSRNNSANYNNNNGYGGDNNSRAGSRR